jgi:hypothetical protein
MTGVSKGMILQMTPLPEISIDAFYAKVGKVLQGYLILKPSS